MPSSAEGLFWVIFVLILAYNILFFENHSIFFHKILYKILKTLWPLFMDGVYYSDALSITFMVIVLLWQSLHERNCFT